MNDRRYRSVSWALRVLEELMTGKTHDRHSIAALGEVGTATADRLMSRLELFPGVLKERSGNRTYLTFNLDAAQPAPSESTLIVACLGTSLSRVFEGSSYEQGMRDALGYLLERAKEERGFRHVDRKFVFVSQGGEIALPEKRAVLDALIRAVLESRWVELAYEHFQGNREAIRMQPLTITVYQHQVYIIGRGPSTAYPYRLARIHDVTVQAKFTYPGRTNYDPEQIFRDSFGIFITDNYKVHRVALRLLPELAVHARTHRWHRSQRTEEQPGGGVLLHLQTRVCPELETFILGLGERAEVIRPQFLRKRIAKRARDLAGVYGG